MFTLVKQAKIVEVINSKRAYRNFLHVIEKIASIFVEVYEFQLKAVVNYETQLIKFIDVFRHHMRMKKIRKKKKRYSIQHSSSTKTKNQSIVYFHFEINNKKSLSAFAKKKRMI